MRPRSDRRWRMALGVLVLVMASHVCAAAADNEDEALTEAQLLCEQGHIVQAEALLRRLALDGQVQAMERLAMLHWYGPALYPGGPWKPEVAHSWFERAAEQGSTVGGYMLVVVQRARGNAAVSRMPTQKPGGTQ